ISPRLRIAVRRSSGSLSFCATSKSFGASPDRKNACSSSRRTAAELSVRYNCCNSLCACTRPSWRIASNHVTAQNGAFDRSIGRRSVDFRQNLARFRSPKHSQILNGLRLQIGIALPPRDFAQDLPRLRRTTLRQDEQRLGFFLRRRGAALQNFPQQWHGAFRVAIHQPANGQHAKLIIFLRFRMNLLAGGLANLDLQRGEISLPAALRKAPLEFGDGGQRRVLLAQPILRISLPVESSIGLRAVHLRQLIELRFGAVVAVFVERFAAVLVQLAQAIQALLLAVAFFLLPVARFLFAIPLLLLAISSFLFAVALFLLLVLTVLLHFAGVIVAIDFRCRHALRRSGLWRIKPRANNTRGPLRESRPSQQNRNHNPGSVSHA